MLRWAGDEGVPVAVVGLGSNLLVADEGVDALVLKLGGELAAVDADVDGLDAGGGAPLAVCLHRSRAAGLGGIEFVCAIPGTVGGGVWMNAGRTAGTWPACSTARSSSMLKEPGTSHRRSSGSRIVARVSGTARSWRRRGFASAQRSR